MKVTKVIPPIVFVHLILLVSVTLSADPVQRRKSGKYRRGIGPSNVTEASREGQDERVTKLPQLDEFTSSVEDNFIRKRQKEQLTDVILIEKTEQVLSSWSAIQSYTSTYMKHMLEERVQPILEELFEKTDVTIACESAIRTVLKDASRMQKYALQSK